MIELEQLTRVFGEQTAVDHLDLTVPSGQLLGLLGPNGAGKSTTIKMLTGLLRPTSGTARIEGHDVVREPLAVKRAIGYVPETGAVFEALTAWEYLTMVGALYHLDDTDSAARIAQLAQYFELDNATMRDKQLGAFSKGMRQKVSIIGALLHNPPVVFLDEPLMGLDANAALSFKSLVQGLVREGKTVVYCSHILDVVERLCERVVIIHQGRIVADGTVAALLAEHGEPSLELVFNRLTGTRDLLQRTEELARALGELA